MTLIVRQEAAEDARLMTAQLRATRPRIANQFAAQLTRTFRLLELFPHLGSEFPPSLAADPNLRFMTMQKFHRVVIVFLPLPDGVDVFRVLEGNRDLAALLAEL